MGHLGYSEMQCIVLPIEGDNLGNGLLCHITHDFSLVGGHVVSNGA